MLTPGRPSPRAVGFSSVARNCNDARLLQTRMPPEPLANVVAIEAWETQVKQHDLRFKPFRDVYRHVAVDREIDLMPIQPQQHCQGVHLVQVVFHHQDA